MTSQMILVTTGSVISAALSLAGICHLFYRDTKLQHRGNLYIAAGSGTQMIEGILTHNQTLASIHAAITALSLYFWWSNGGGDGMRRMWKKIKDRIPGRAPLAQGA